MFKVVRVWERGHCHNVTGATRCQPCRKQIYFNIRGVNMYKHFRGTMNRCNWWIDKLEGLSKWQLLSSEVPAVHS